MPETYSNSVRQPSGMVMRLRSLARHALISSLSNLENSNRQMNFVRCLMMHYVFDDQRQEFSKLISLLKSMGKFVTTDEAVAMLRGDVPIDGRYFHLSFDDGLDCVARNAAPILQAHRIPAIVFVNSAVMENPTNEEHAAWLKATNYARPLRVMSWSTLRESGLEVGAHTRTHARLSLISEQHEKLYTEVAGCKKDIEHGLEQECKYFAWPNGRKCDIDQRGINMIRSEGFQAAFGVFREPAFAGRTDVFSIPRHHIEPQWPLSHVRYFAKGGWER